MTAPTEIAAKLRLTSLALGCRSRKELCGRFRAANPATYFDLQRAHKWLQGKAEPRIAGVYQDWAKVLGLARSGAWVAASSLAEFQAELRGRFGPRMDRMPEPRPQSRATAALGVDVSGLHAAYSWAWSPHFGGRVLRAMLQISRLRSGALRAEYREDLPVGAMIYQGDALVAGRMLHLPLHELTTGLPLFMSFALPGPPASVMCGVQCGCAMLSHSAEPTAGRILLVRLRGAPDLRASNRYLMPEESLTGDLAALGLDCGPGLEALLRGMLGGVERVTTREQEQLAAAFDPLFLAD